MIAIDLDEVVYVDSEEVAYVETTPKEKRVVFYLKGNSKAFVLTGDRGGNFMRKFIAYHTLGHIGSESLPEEGGGAYWEDEKEEVKHE